MYIYTLQALRRAYIARQQWEEAAICTALIRKAAAARRLPA